MENNVKFEVRNLSKAFGGLKALDQVSFSVSTGAIMGLIGPNGSGKSTLFNCVTKVLKPDSGQVYLDGARIDGLPAYRIARRGVGRTFQEIRLFRELSVMENMAIAAMGAGIRWWRRRALEALTRLEVPEKAEKKCADLSVGQQKLIELAICMMVGNDFIMLDEPVAGVNPVIVKKITDHIKQCKREGKTFLIVEHDIPFIMGLSDRLTVLHLGEKLAEGEPTEIRENKEVLDAYLGTRES